MTKSRGASEQILESKKVELELVFSVSIFCSLALLDFAKVKRPSIVPGLCIFTNHSFGSRLLPGSPGSPWKIKIFWDLRSAYGKCYHFFGHPRVLDPGCALGALTASETFGISEKNRQDAHTKHRKIAKDKEQPRKAIYGLISTVNPPRTSPNRAQPLEASYGPDAQVMSL